MNALRYLGDETSAAGMRLAGCEARAVAPGGEKAAFEEACAGAALVMVSPAVAAAIGPASFGAAVARARPPIVVLPDLVGASAWPDPTASLARELGLEG